jgi:hypothetical protein
MGDKRTEGGASLMRLSKMFMFMMLIAVGMGALIDHDTALYKEPQ